jgi:hypothetical protein
MLHLQTTRVRASLTASFVAALLALVTLASVEAGQVGGGEIRGTVRDVTGAVLPGVVVQLTSVERNVSRETVTDAGGRFSAPGLMVGAYVVAAQLAGFGPVQQTVTLNVAEVLPVDLVLRPSGVAETVTVAATAPVVNTTSAMLGQVVEAREIQNIPLNGRNWAQLATLTPGVTQFTSVNTGGTPVYEGGGIRLTVGGARDASNRFLLDGVSMNDISGRTPSGMSSQTLGVDALQQFRVLTSSYGAEFGGAGGGVVTAVTKAGTSQLHGTVSEFVRNDAFDSSDYFATGTKPQFRRNQFGGALGGPAGMPRTFFFGAYEGFRDHLDTSQVATVPDAAARAGILPDGPVSISPKILPFLNSPLFPLPNGRNFGNGTAEYRFVNPQATQDDFMLGRWDYHVTATNAVMARFQSLRSTAETPVDRSPGMFLDQNVRNVYFSAGWQSIMSSRWIASYRVNATSTRRGAVNSARFEVAPALQMLPGRTGNVPPQIDLPSGSIGSTRVAPLTMGQKLFAGRADFAYARGNHNVKFGGNLEGYRYDLYAQQRLSGQFTFTSLRTFLQGTPQTGFIYGGPFVGEPDASNLHFRNAYIETFVQDDWKIRPNLSVNLGLRYEPTTMATEKNSNGMRIAPFDPRDLKAIVVPTQGTKTMVQKNGSLADFAPRLGIVWSPGSGGRTSARAGYGRYFDPILGWPYTHFIAAPTLRTTFTLTNPLFPNAIDSLSLGAQPPPVVAPVDPFLRTPTQDRWSAGMQRELPWKNVIDVNYVGSRGTNQTYAGTWNSPIPDTLADGTLFIPAGRPRRNPALGAVRATVSDGKSWYEGLQVGWSRRDRALTSHVSYTWSQSLDYKSSESSAGGATGEGAELIEIFDLDRNKGRSAFDARHVLTASIVTGVSSVARGPAVTRALASGWNFATIVMLRSGLPFTPGINGDWARRGASSSGNSVPSWAPGRNASNAILGGPDRYFDPTAFVLPLQGTIGNVTRNELEGPGLATVDVAVSRRIPLRAVAGQFRVEVFNLLNRANFDVPNRLVFGGVSQTEAPLATAGVISRTVTLPRSFQFGFSLTF